ncbi:MAG: hypothetical protein WD118_06520 [Phycisphaeraceae bacterium]
MSDAEPPDLQQRLDRVEELIRQIEAFPDPAVSQMGRALTGAILDLHRAGLARTVELFLDAAPDTAARNRLTEALADDQLVNSLLALHGLHPLDLLTRVQRALDSVQPALQRSGVVARAVEVNEHQALLRLLDDEGRPLSDRASSPRWSTVRRTIEQAVAAAAPEVASLAFEGSSSTSPPPPETSIPLPILQAPRR